MKIDLKANTDIIRYSKHFLVKGWGLTEQSKTASVQIDCPDNWNLFAGYLRAMGNFKDNTKPYNLRCGMRGPSLLNSKYEYLMEGVIEKDLQIALKKNYKLLRTWNFALPNTVLSQELLQLSVFLSVTDSIKSGLL